MDKIKIYWVYIHINQKKKKKYIGITSKSPEERWNHGFGYQYNKAFFYDIVKEGGEKQYNGKSRYYARKSLYPKNYNRYPRQKSKSP